MDGYCFYHQKSTSGVAHDVCFMFQVKTLFYLLSIWYSWSIKNHVFRHQKDLKLVYLWASVALEIWMDKYFITKNQLVEWLVMFAICFSQSIVIFTFNMLLVNGKLSFRSQKELKLTFLWASVAWHIWLFKSFYQLVKWLVMFAWYLQLRLCYIYFQIVIAQWKIIFQKSKRPQTHLLTVISSITNMAGHMLQSPKINL